MPLTPVPNPPRPKLLIARQSDRRISEDLYDTIDTTLRPYVGYPEVDWIKALPAEIVRKSVEGAALRNSHGVTVMRPPGRRRVIGYLIRRGDWYCLVVPDSASKEAEDGTNDFVTLLVDLINRLRPGMVGVAEFKRLVRSFAFGGETFRALRQHNCTLVEGGTTRLDPRSSEAMSTFAVKTLLSDGDREATTERLLHGLLHDLERGRWPYAEEYLPDGYRFARRDDGARSDGTVELDPSTVPAVQELLRLAATEVSDAEIARIVGPLGIRAPRLTLERRRSSNDQTTTATIDELQDPALALRNKLVRCLSVWGTGKLQVAVANPLPRREVRGIEAEADETDTASSFRFELDLGGRIPGVSDGTAAR